MYYIQDPFACVPLLWERLSVLFAELRSFTYACNFLFGESRESGDNSFRLHSLKLLEIDVAYPLVPQLYVSVGSLALGIHCRIHLVRVEDEHLTFSPTPSDESAFFFDEASSIIEADLHALFDYLAN